MRAARTLLATLARGEGAYLNARQPTGLTGVLTHPSPRPHLIRLYNETLERLRGLPEHSAYRTATENLTKHRLRIIEDAKPDGLEDWRERMRKSLDQHAGWARQLAEDMVAGRGYRPQRVNERDDRVVEWDDDIVAERAEGPRSSDPTVAQQDQAKDFGAGLEVAELTKQHVVLEDEPPLTAGQISDIEQKLNAGLLEEVVIVAQRELELVGHMKEAAVWEELAERPADGQWQYFERDPHVEHSKIP